MLYAKSTGGFYAADIHNDIPADAVEITAEEHAAMIEGQSVGRLIQADESGRPVLVDAPPPTIEQVRAEKLAQLDAARKAAETASVTVAGKPFPATEEFQAKISRSLNYIGRGKPLDLTGAWRDSNAQAVTMTSTLLGQIEDAITSQGVNAWKKYWTKFDAVMAAQDAAAVDAVSW
jgi:hypothetical protein